MKQFMRAGRSVVALSFVFRKMLTHILWELVRHGESQKFVRGRALIARLMRTALDLGIPVWTGRPQRG